MKNSSFDLDALPDRRTGFFGLAARLVGGLRPDRARASAPAPRPAHFRADLLRGERVLAVNAPEHHGPDLCRWVAGLGAGGIVRVSLDMAFQILEHPLPDTAALIIWSGPSASWDETRRLLRRLRECGPDLPLVLVADGASRADFGGTADDDADCVLPAGFGPTGLKLALESAVNNRKRQRNRIPTIPAQGKPQPRRRTANALAAKPV